MMSQTPHWLRSEQHKGERLRTTLTVVFFSGSILIGLGLVTLGVIGFVGMMSEPEPARAPAIAERVEQEAEPERPARNAPPGAPSWGEPKIGEEIDSEPTPPGLLRGEDIYTLIEPLYLGPAEGATLSSIRRFAGVHGVDLTHGILVEELWASENKAGFAMAIGWVGGPNAYPVLRSLLVETNPASRSAGIHGLAMVGDKRMFPELRDMLLYDDSDSVRKEICIVLGKFKDWGAVENLATLLSDRDRGVRKNAHWALKQITGQKNLDDDPNTWYEWMQLRALIK